MELTHLEMVSEAFVAAKMLCYSNAAMRLASVLEGLTRGPIDAVEGMSLTDLLAGFVRIKEEFGKLPEELRGAFEGLAEKVSSLTAKSMQKELVAMLVDLAGDDVELVRIVGTLKTRIGW